MTTIRRGGARRPADRVVAQTGRLVGASYDMERQRIISTPMSLVNIMASAPPAAARGRDLRQSMLRVIDTTPQTYGLGLVYIDHGRLLRLRPQGDSGATVVVERRSGGTSGQPSPHVRTAGTSPATEWMNLGFNCGGAVLAWVGVAGLAALAPVSGGAGGLGAVFLYGGALAASSQCVVSAYRGTNLMRGRGEINDRMDANIHYQRYSIVADGIGLLGAGGALKELKVAHTAIVESGVGWRAVRGEALSRPLRRRLTASLGVQSVKRLPGHVIDRYVRQRLIDGFAGVVGLIASSASGNINQLVVWITEEAGPHAG